MINCKRAPPQGKNIKERKTRLDEKEKLAKKSVIKKINTTTNTTNELTSELCGAMNRPTEVSFHFQIYFSAPNCSIFLN